MLWQVPWYHKKALSVTPWYQQSWSRFGPDGSQKARLQADLEQIGAGLEADLEQIGARLEAD